MKSNKVALSANSYIQVLDTLSHPPKQLFYLGTLPSVRMPSVAIVGTRKPTTYGREVTFNLAYNLAKKGVVIVSGLAYGVDAIAHQAALEAGGTTIAVLANGLDDIYPKSHKALAEKIIAAGGAIISEYPEGTGAHKHHFLARNRIVSGLSDAVVVTEAAARSGTLSTVNHALDQNKEVFAVPGNITSLVSIGPNSLIEQGAHPVLSVDSILTVIKPELIATQMSLLLPEDPLQATIVSSIDKGIRNGAQLLIESKATTSDYLIAMTSLELSGVIQSLGADQWSRC